MRPIPISIPSALLAVSVALGPAPAVHAQQRTVVVVQPVALGAPVHRGLYVRLALGGGALVDDFSGPFGWYQASASGGSGALSIMVGGTIADRLVLGGAGFVDWVVDPVVESDGVTVSSDVRLGALTVVGPFLEWYLGRFYGWHVHGALGWARISIEDETGARSAHEPMGGGVVLGGGYDFWLGPSLALGVLGRITSAVLADDGITHRVGAAALLVSLTWY